MRRQPGIVTGALLAGVLAGCGGGGTGSAHDPRAQAHLSQRVQQGSPHLPDGFADRPEQAWQMPFTKGDADCRALLEPVGGQAPGEALTAQVAVSYRGFDLGEQAGVGLARYADEQAEGHLEALAAAMRSCRAVRTATGTDLRLRELPIGRVGDETLGARLRGRLNGYPYALDLVLTRVGDTLVSVVHTGLPDVDHGRTREVVDAAVSMASA
ncbi:hypothetical protein SAMN05421874_101497 [Nonomuraea maritima]|uniref:PknH-like extracellular domain-containing protein n=1 Tax=Nonomuraea maritima TaxID=683260 RepID=A0A1G8SYE7_9ACTN|nr:hypothetical protein [Nonomuraea maritima]SDJ34196.1 hypothetical protein SAMN05421874_101497 [Nonomuraea maritima]